MLSRLNDTDFDTDVIDKVCMNDDASNTIEFFDVMVYWTLIGWHV